MTDISVIILTKDEKLHIRRCLEKILPLEPRQIFVVDCFSTDETKTLVESFTPPLLHSSTPSLHFVEHEWPGNQAAQFNWALDTLPIKSKWVLRMDADEYLSDGLIQEMKSFVASPQEDVTLVSLPLSRRWMQCPIRFGVPKVYIPRLFVYGVCRYGNREMDEKLCAETGRTMRFHNEFVDDNLNSLAWWKAKHRNYAEREARQALNGTHGNKSLYYRLPPYIRAVAYWAIRYFLFCGFLDGRAGGQWNFWQGLWYRWLVDRRIGQMRKEAVARQDCG